MPSIPPAMAATAFSGTAAANARFVAEHRIAGVPFQRQANDNWCWAAIGRAIVSIRQNRLLPQCEIVTRRFGADNCPPAVPRDEIDDLSDVLPRVLDISVAYRNRNLLDRPNDAYRELEAAIRQDRPVAVNINWSGTFSGHYVCAYGVGSVDGRRGFWIYDPSRRWASTGHSRFMTLEGMERYTEAPDAAGNFGRWIEAFWPDAA